MVQQATSGGKAVEFLPEQHTDFIFVGVPAELPWLVAGLVLVAGAGILWWWRRRRARPVG